MNAYHSFLDYLEETPTIIQVVWFSSVIFLLLILVLVLYLKYLRSHLRQNERIESVYNKKFESNLITYLYSGNEDEEITAEQLLIINRLKKNTADPFKRKVLISTLLKLRNEISGEMARSIQNLYIQTGLLNYAIAKLKSKNWELIAKGINELTQFHIKEVHDEIIQFINHPKNEVRKEVQLYSVNLFNFKGLSFLNIIETKLSEWDQIQLLEVLQKFGEQQTFDVKPWLQSSNDSVISFALKLTEIYNQFDAIEELIALLNYPDEKIRIEAIQVLNYFTIVEAKSILKDNFHSVREIEQIAVFKMMANVYELEDENFILENIVHPNFEIKLRALKILKDINIENFNINKQIVTNTEFHKIVNFIETN
jgi:hypothetical protein